MERMAENRKFQIRPLRLIIRFLSKLVDCIIYFLYLAAQFDCLPGMDFVKVVCIKIHTGKVYYLGISLEEKTTVSQINNDFGGF